MRRNRIDETFARLKQDKRVGLIGLIPIDPASMQKTHEIADMIIASGVDFVMVHIPNWMPWMEGRVLQMAALAPRNAGVTRQQIFGFIKELRDEYPDIPIIDMTLYDTVVTMGQENFIELSEAADVDGFDLPNYPLLSTDDKFGFYRYCLENNRHLILAISYELATAGKGTAEYEMLRRMAEYGRGFVFVMNAPGGQSGSAVKLTREELMEAVARVKGMMEACGNYSCTVSIVCGISGKEDIDKVKDAKAQSFMIGSAYVKYLQDGRPVEEISDYLKGISQMCMQEEKESC